MQVTENIREWDYGDYEGKTSKQIREVRKEQGMGEWDIWRDGCPGGEYVVFSPFQENAFPNKCGGVADVGGSYESVEGTRG